MYNMVAGKDYLDSMYCSSIFVSKCNSEHSILKKCQSNLPL